MRRYTILFLLLCVLNCTNRYTRIGEKQVLSLDEKLVTYSISSVSTPSVGSPYIVLKAQEVVRIKEKYREQVKISTSVTPLTFSPLFGIIPGINFITKGYVVLGRDIIGLSILTQAAILAGIMLPSDRITWRSQSEERLEKKVSSCKKFTLNVIGEDFSNDYLSDNDGILKINIADFVPFYKAGKNLEFKLVTPNGDSTAILIANDEIVPMFLKER